MSKPRLLDLFCGGGGAAKGYQRAGFYVVGVDEWGGIYVIENVEDAKAVLMSPVVVCGSSLGLPDIERHRCFESNVALMVPPCAHGLRGSARFPGTPRANGTRPLSRVANPMASGISHEVFAEAMGIDWMPATGFRPSRELHEAIPPAYTEFVGEQLLSVLRAGSPVSSLARRAIVGMHESEGGESE